MKNLRKIVVVLLVMVVSLALFTGCTEADGDPTFAEMVIYATGVGCMNEALDDAAPGSDKGSIFTNVNWTNTAETATVVGSGTYDDYECEWTVADFHVHFLDYYSFWWDVTITGDFDFIVNGDSGDVEGSYEYDGNTASFDVSGSDVSVNGTITINGTTFSASHFIDVMESSFAEKGGKVKLPRFLKVK